MILGFLLTLGILIVFHEFGHFIVARLCGVKVLRFSIGFGKPLLRWKSKAETEYVLALFPLGGYVKMLGESLDEEIPLADKAGSFSHKPLWQRMSIIAAGPIANFILAFIALWIMLVVGTYSLAPIVGKITPNSLASQMHLKPMDEIMSINDESVNTWQDVLMALMNGIGEKKPQKLVIYNIADRMYDILSLPLESVHLDKKESSDNFLEFLGITPALPTIQPDVAVVEPNQPAAMAGFLKGDRIITVEQEHVKDWTDVVTLIQKNPNHPLKIQVERRHEIITLVVTPVAKKTRGREIGFIGLETMPAKDLFEMWFRKEHYSFFAAIQPALIKTGHLIDVTVRMMAKLLTGSLSLHTISGPIGMAKWAGQALSLGTAYFCSFIALVSISLGVLNLLPIPVLDGGHLFYGLCEFILRRPLSQKARVLGSQIGLIFVGALMLLAIVNDLSRLILS